MIHTKKPFGLHRTVVIALITGTILFSGCKSKAILTTEETSLGPVSLTSTQSVVISTMQATSNPETIDIGIPSQTPAISTPVLTEERSPVQSTYNLGTIVSFDLLSFFLPQGVASGASGNHAMRNDSEDTAWWQKTPGHLQVILGDYYVLQGNIHQPQIYIYPTQAYAEMVPTVFESLHRLYNILGVTEALIEADQLPVVPFFNAKQDFASNIQVISFQNGSGVRFLTHYSQYPALVNNQELFYQFQGVTSNGAYYIIAILPINAPFLSENSEIALNTPMDGINYPDTDSPNPTWNDYFTAVTELSNTTSPGSFTPTIDLLDMLIQSIKIAN